MGIVFRVFKIFDGKFAVDGADFSSQVTDTGFTGVIFDDVIKGLIGPFHHTFFDAVVFFFKTDKMGLGDSDLFKFGVSVKFNHLKTVEERTGNLRNVISGTDKENLRQVKGLIEIVIGKEGVLFRIQNFQKSRGRVAVISTAVNLIDFI